MGVTTIGEKGQVVIPADIREYLKLNKGDKLMVFTKSDAMIGIIKVSNIEEFTTRLTSHLDTIKGLAKNTKNKKNDK